MSPQLLASRWWVRQVRIFLRDISTAQQSEREVLEGMWPVSPEFGGKGLTLSCAAGTGWSSRTCLEKGKHPS